MLELVKDIIKAELKKKKKVDILTVRDVLRTIGYYTLYKDTKVYKKHKKTIKSIDKELYQPAIEQRAANQVSNMGYRVKDVKFKKGDSKIKVKARRGGEDYKIELGYPSYNVIKIKKD